MDKRFWAVLGVIVLIFVGIIWVNGKKAGAPDGGSGSAQPSNHIKGENTKNVTLVEYGDFQCPVCYSYYPTVEQVFNKYKSDIAFQFRNFPLTQLHPNAFAGARAAEAAGLQNKYWEMHDLLYQNQDPNGASGWVASSTPQSFFNTFAQQIGINVDQFKKDYASSKVNDTINADLKAGKDLKVDGTPSFFLNGKMIELKDLVTNGTPDVEKFNKLIDDAIAKSDSSKSSTESKQ